MSAEPRKGPSQSPSSVLERLRSLGVRAERYTSREELARGGMGAIVRVWDGELQRQLAMKVMLGKTGEHADSASAAASEGRRVARFLDEAHITGQLDHPGIVPVHELGLDERGQLYFTMRLVKGRELREVFELVATGGDGWTLTRALGVVLKVCEAMSFAHEKGVIHRDLKPANVMVGRFGEVYVMDWGLAKVLGREDAHDVRLAQPDATHTLVRSARSEMKAEPDSPLSTMDGDVVGTPCYMSPEQARGRLEDIGPQSDVYSVGAMLYELLGGEKPYCPNGEQPSPSAVLGALMHSSPRALASLKKDIPEELIAICDKAMARDVRERYADMLGLTEDLRAYLEGRVVGAYETGPIAEFKKWIARNKAFAGALAAALLIALIGLGVALSVQHAANVELRAANSVIEDRNRNLQEQERETRSAYEQLSDAIALQKRINDQLTLVTAEAQSSAALALKRGYSASIAGADGALRSLDIGAAARLLDEGCEESLRDWEWRHLRARCDDSVGKFDLADTPLEALAATADGRWVAAAWEHERQRTLQIRDADTGELVRDLGAQNSLIVALAFDASGARLASLSSERKVHVYDTERGTLVTSWTERVVPAQSLRFTPDGAQLLTATSDGSARVYDTSTGAVVREFGGLPRRLSRLELSRDAARFAAASRDGEVSVFSFATGAIERRIERRSAPVLALAFDATGERLLVGGGHARSEIGALSGEFDRALELWSVDDGSLLRTYPGHEDSVLWCAFSADNTTFASVSADRSIRVWDVASGSSNVRLGHAARLVAAAAIGRSERIATIDYDGVLRTWDWSAGAVADIAALRQAISLLTFSSDGKTLVAAGQDGLVRAWNAVTGTALWVDDGLVKGGISVGRVRAFAVHPTTAELAIASSQRLIRLRDLATGKSSGEIDDEGASQATALAYSRDGARLASGTSLGEVRIYSSATRALERSFATGQPVTALAWSPDDRQIVVATLQGGLQVWRIADESRVDLAALQGAHIGSLDLDALSGRLFTRSSAQIEAWSNLAPNAPRISVTGSGGDGLQLSSSGSRFATRTSRGVALHESERLAPLVELRREASGPTAFAVARAGGALAAGYSDGLIRAWFDTPAATRDAERRAARRVRDLALPLVERLFADQVDCAAASAAIAADEAISDNLRSAALALVRMCDARVEFLLGEARATAAARGMAPGDYSLATWQIRRARQLDADDHRLVACAGALAYRRGEFARASELLRDAMRMQPDRRIEPEIAGYLALSELALDRASEAQPAIDEFRELMRTVEINSRDRTNVELGRELERELARPR